MTLLIFPCKFRRRRTTNAIERLHQEQKRCSEPVQIFPNLQSCLRLFGAMLEEQHNDWITGRQYLKMDEYKNFLKKMPDQFSASEDPQKEPIKPTIV